MVPRSCVLVTAPLVEPVSLLEAKTQLRLLPEQTDDDVYILGLIAAGRMVVESRLGVSLVATQWRATWTDCPSVAHLPKPPLLVSGEYPITIEADGEAVDVGDYTLEDDSQPAIITFDPVPSGMLQVTFWAGVPAGGVVAAQIKAALLMFVAHLYAHRESVTDGQSSEMPHGFEMLLASGSVLGRW